jgi:methylase of polypeptide subunit release factors
MKKRSKLEEKSARMPEIRESKWDQIVSTYLEAVQNLGTESAKSHRFSALLNDLFGLETHFIEEYVVGIEKYLKVRQKDQIVGGRVDNLFGSLVIEFERDLAKTKGEAEEQLRKYVAAVWSEEPPGKRRPYLCLATDGVSFVVYSPAIPEPSKGDVEPDEVGLQLIEQVNLTRLEPAEVYFWLDRYFLRQELLSPKTENIVKDFGIKSHAFRVSGQALLSLWGALKDQPEFAVVYQSWEKYLLIVYGSSVADEELFIRHTYLATLAKLMAWCRLTGARTGERDEILSVLEGQFFKKQGIENFLEEDFFSWVTREEAREAGVDSARMLFSLLQNYNLRELCEDVLKSLYQELVDPETRHDLGEYYTPDWLAHRIVRKLLEEKPEATLLDPACGSGTFLYLAIQEKRDRLGDSLDALNHIQGSVVGVDIHPLAVIVAKTNYILALGDLLKKRGRITIPVYLADTMRLPEWRDEPTLWMQLPSYLVKLDDSEIYLPEKLLSQPGLYDQAIEAAREFAVESAGDSPSREQFTNYLQAGGVSVGEDDALTEALFLVSETLRGFVESKRDTIWAFVLKNIYKPLFLRDKFDYVVGNPPWLAYRYAEPEYQKFLKEQITETYRLLTTRGELITHLELASLFLLRTADLYLKGGGTIAFVLPRSLFSADQHGEFRQAKFTKVGLGINEIWDLEGVSPLFNVPSCVLFARKGEHAEIAYPISGEELGGKLERRNTALSDAEEALSIEEVLFFLSRVGKRSFWSTGEAVEAERASYYAEHFRQGATIVPRSLWFVEVATSPLGFDPSLPPLESGRRARRQAKAPYKDLVLEGNVESRFLYATLLSTDLLPFGHLDYRLVVLPIEPFGEGYRLISAEEAREQGFLHLARWLEKAQGEWESRRGDKAGRMTIYERLDRVHGLTRQRPRASYRVLYPKSATYLCAAMVEERPIAFDIDGQHVGTKGFVADYVTYYLETTQKQEAYYLVAVLNAPVIDRLIKPMQARGQWGARDITKKVLEFPIAQFDVPKAEHLELAELGEACTEKVAEWLEAGGPGKVRAIGRLRAMVREMLAEELEQIDQLVEPLLQGD